MLSSNVPEGDLNILKLQRLHVEPYGWYCCDKLPLLQLTKDRRLARPVQAQGDDPHLYLWPDVHPVVLCEGDWDGGVEVELVGAEV